MSNSPSGLLPVDVVFHPEWWHSRYGLDFREPFHFDPEVRVESERLMRQALQDRFGDLGLGEAGAQPRPVVGPVHLAIGFVVQAMLGCQVRFSADAFFSLRLSPARLRSQTPDQVRADVVRLLDQAGPLAKAALCCIAMDSGTPDDNVRAIFEVAAAYRCQRG
jgi:hypothetical protein